MKNVQAYQSQPFQHCLMIKEGRGSYRIADDEVVMQRAMQILLSGLQHGPALDSPKRVEDYLRLRIGLLEHEVFVVLFLNAQHELIEFEELFRGTLTQTSVYPREVLKRCLHHNAGAVVFAHNHPSGTAEPSRADESLTDTLRAALRQIDVRVLDHLIVTRAKVISMANLGLV